MRTLACLFPILAFTIIGCGPTVEKTYPVTATVTLDGKPLAEGVLYFFPATGGGAIGGEFRDGAIRFEAPAGTMRVELRAYRLMPGVKAPPEARPGTLIPDPFINYLPAKYHAESTLSATVKSGEPNEFTFELSSR